MKQVTPMELLNLFHKSASADVNLTVYEQKLFSVILTYVNHDLTDGYKAWPSTDTLIRQTGMSAKTIERSRKILIDGDWCSIVSGKGKGSSNTYYVNAEKIVQVANKAGAKASDKPIAQTKQLPEAKPPHKRNTDGLMQGNQSAKVLPIASSVVHGEEPITTWFDEPVIVLPIRKATPTPANTDGSNPFHPNGTRCYSYADHATATQRHIDEINSGDEPF